MPSHPVRIPAARLVLVSLLLGGVSAPVLAQALASDTEVAQTIDRDQVVVVGDRARRAGGGTKTDTPVAITPQSIAVITADQMIERGALSLQDALMYSAGVRSDAYGNDSRIDSYLVRGTRPLQYLDGMRTSFDSYNVARNDTYMLERVEVVKGPASVLYGQGSVGGVINLTSKRPGFTASNEVLLSYGSHNRKQAQVDLTGPVDEAGTLAFRVTGLFRTADTQVDHVDDDRWFIAPQLTWRPTDRTEATIQLYHQKDDTGLTTQFFPWSGTLYDNPNGKIDFDTFIGEPAFDDFKAEQTNVSAFLAQGITDWLQVRQNFRAAWSEVTYQTIYSNSFSNPLNPFLSAGQAGYTGPQRNVTRYLSGTYPDVRILSSDTQLQGDINTGTISHMLLAGMDWQDYRQELEQITSRLTSAIDLFNPVYNANFTAPARTKGNTAEQKQMGFYFQDQIKWEGWNLLLGLRHDSAKSSTLTPAGVKTRKKDDATSYRAGLLYEATGGIAPYISYSESFLPVAGTNLAGVPFDPQIGKQWEAGVKWQPQADILVTTAIFDLRDTNRVTTSPTNPLDRVQTGEIKAQGFEFEAQATVAELYTVTASYTYTDAKTSKSNVATEIGKPASSTPRHLASAFITRTFPLENGAEIKVGGGVRYVGSQTDQNSARTIIINTPANTLADLMMSYNYEAWRLSLNVTNVTDESYISTCLARGGCFLGSRRSIVGTVGYRF
ncbi:TonB-dependent siderophore receptor [Niveispirillum sp. KHB5.9]|uniref:TonB-dependent siderophore receptor n=1 Tax=Niveispirillum sp. KHB5.9 TaxID=3400269 RepID=UPI003A8BDCB7